MLWLIQRDFLEGKTVQQMVSEALSAVPNPSRNPDIAQVCTPSETAAALQLAPHLLWLSAQHAILMTLQTSFSETVLCSFRETICIHTPQSA